MGFSWIDQIVPIPIHIKQFNLQKNLPVSTKLWIRFLFVLYCSGRREARMSQPITKFSFENACNLGKKQEKSPTIL